MTLHVLHDELEQLLNEAETDESKLVTLIAVYAHSVADRWDIAQHYHQRIQEISDKWSNGENVAAGVQKLCSVLFFYYTTKFDKVAESADETIAIFENLDEPDLLGVGHMIKGVTNRSLGQFDDGIKHLTKATKLIDQDGPFKVYHAFANYQCAEIFVQLKDYELAEKHYLDAEYIAQTTDDDTAKFRMTNGIGNYYLVTEQWDIAIDYLDRALAMSVAPSQRSRALCDLGIYHTKQGEIEKAIECLEESYQIRVENGFEDASSTALIHLGFAKLARENTKEAIEHGTQALEITQKFNSKQKTLLCYQLLADAYLKEESWKLATQFLKSHQRLQEIMNSQQMRNIYKTKNKMINEQKDLIEEAHKEITDSIAYAKRIQTAILPSDSQMDKNLKDHFVLYLPKDVVAGDFYWLEEDAGVIYFAAADCTGHGVPGAMVSVVCHNALNRAVREYGLSIPGKILDKTRDIVISEFSKSDEDVKDGMDICLCALRGMSLQFSGAHNSLWLIRKGELIEYKGNKQPVGKFINAHTFETETISLEEGDTYYIFTDGYVDQFGGEKGKKFKAKNLKTLLLSIQDKSLQEQQQILHENFNDWRGSIEQIDDVCMIGVRV